MKTILPLAAAFAAGIGLAGAAQAMPLAPAGASAAPIVNVDTVVTRTVRRGPLGGRVVTRRVVRRPAPMGTTVTTTRTVR